MFGYSNSNIINEKKDDAKSIVYNIDKYIARFFEHAIKYRYNKAVQSSSWVTTICNMNKEITTEYNRVSDKQFNSYTRGIEASYLEGYNNCKNTKGNSIVPQNTDLLSTFPTVYDIMDTTKVNKFLIDNLRHNSEAEIELRNRGIY